MVIRTSRIEDYEQLIELEHLIWNYGNTPLPMVWESVADYAGHFPPGSQFVAIEDRRVAGYMSVKYPTPLESNRHVWEMAIGVHPDFQGKGVGRKLLDFLDAEGRKHGIRKICLRVLSTNTPAISFYKKNGYIEQGVLKGEFFLNGQYVDDLLMYKELID
jgi:ribosomal protein S18 acetylase RimI-like enzyme